VKISLCGDAMTGPGVDQALPIRTPRLLLGEGCGEPRRAASATDVRRLRESISHLAQNTRGQLDVGAKLLLEKETLAREELPPLEQLTPTIAAATAAAI